MLHCACVSRGGYVGTSKGALRTLFLTPRVSSLNRAPGITTLRLPPSESSRASEPRGVLTLLEALVNRDGRCRNYEERVANQEPGFMFILAFGRKLVFRSPV
jgi:hypothetical protein